MDPLEALEVLQRALKPKPSPTVRVLWEKWADVHRRKLADFPTEEGRSRHLLAFFGAREAATLTIWDLDGEDGYRAKRKYKLRGGAPLRPATRNREVDLLQRILNFSVHEGLLTVNPIAHASDEPEDSVQHTKIESEEKLAALLDEASPMVRALMLCWFETGARRMEIMGLKWSQIEAGGWVVFPRTKNREARRAKLAPRALEALRDLPRYEDCPWIFANPETLRPYNPRHLARQFARTVVAAGIEGVNGESVTPHKFRHGFAYRLRRQLRLPERAVMKMGGWKTDVAFKRYGIVDEEEAEEGWNVVALAGEIKKGVDRKPPQRVHVKGPEDAVLPNTSRV